jgi:hypothetical protein
MPLFLIHHDMAIFASFNRGRALVGIVVLLTLSIVPAENTDDPGQQVRIVVLRLLIASRSRL